MVRRRNRTAGIFRAHEKSKGKIRRSGIHGTQIKGNFGGWWVSKRARKPIAEYGGYSRPRKQDDGVKVAGVIGKGRHPRMDDAFSGTAGKTRLLFPFRRVGGICRRMFLARLCPMRTCSFHELRFLAGEDPTKPAARQGGTAPAAPLGRYSAAVLGTRDTRLTRPLHPARGPAP